MIHIHQLYHKIQNKFILSDISAEFPQGKLTSVIGPNGAGKSTLIHLIAGGEKPSNGSININKKDINAYTTAELARQRAVLAQQNNLSFPIEVEDIIKLGRQPYAKEESPEKSKKAIDYAIELWKIESMLNRNYSSLSGGEKQRVQFARIWAQLYSDDLKGKILFLDEPLTFLDIYHQLEFMELLQKQTEKGLTVVAVFHQLELALKHSDHLLLLNLGQLEYTGSAEKLPDSVFSKVFQVQIHRLKDSKHIAFGKFSTPLL